MKAHVMIQNSDTFTEEDAKYNLVITRFLIEQSVSAQSAVLTFDNLSLEELVYRLDIHFSDVYMPSCITAVDPDLSGLECTFFSGYVVEEEVSEQGYEPVFATALVINRY